MAETSLRDQVQNALDETRMLVLGAQVTLGFQFQAAFQSGFEKLPEPAQDLTVAGLVLMLVATGLLLAPGAYHQIVERGNDSPQLIAFTNGIAGLARLPFALAMSIDAYVTASVVLSAGGATAFAVGVAVFALFFWYGLEWILRTGDRRATAMDETDLSTRIKHVLTEARVVLPG